MKLMKIKFCKTDIFENVQSFPLLFVGDEDLTVDNYVIESVH